MKPFNPEQFMSIGKTSFDAYVAMSTKAFEGLQKLAELNVSTLQAAAAESTATMQKLATVKDPQALIAFAQSQAQPNTDKLVAYGRAVYDIVAASGAELSKAAEAQVEKAKVDTAAFIDTVTQNAPPGSESAMAAWKSAMTAGNSAYENFNKVAKSAVATAKTQVERAANASVKARAA